ncbi:MAG: hypothetical protein HY329_01155 [Chloroflexi bacterium]|nr:hypothetical protein [Chloroflexota bacterium]
MARKDARFGIEEYRAAVDAVAAPWLPSLLKILFNHCSELGCILRVFRMIARAELLETLVRPFQFVLVPGITWSRNAVQVCTSNKAKGRRAGLLCWQQTTYGTGQAHPSSPNLAQLFDRQVLVSFHGVSGFVCTGQTVDGQPGLEGYYFEYDRELAPDERLRFAPGEESPPFDPAAAPRVAEASWPTDRLRKAMRNYTMEYVRTVLQELVDVFGPADARYLGNVTGCLIGMQFYDRTADLLGVSGTEPTAFAEYLVRLATAQGDAAEWERDGDAALVRQRTWRLMRGISNLPAASFEAWNGLWEGALSVHNRRLRLEVLGRLDLGDSHFEWRIRPRPTAASV